MRDTNGDVDTLRAEYRNGGANAPHEADPAATAGTVRWIEWVGAATNAQLDSAVAKLITEARPDLAGWHAFRDQHGSRILVDRQGRSHPARWGDLYVAVPLLVNDGDGQSMAPGPSGLFDEAEGLLPERDAA